MSSTAALDRITKAGFTLVTKPTTPEVSTALDPEQRKN
jgi:hypothetical protein